VISNYSFFPIAHFVAFATATHSLAFVPTGESIDSVAFPESLLFEVCSLKAKCDHSLTNVTSEWAIGIGSITLSSAFASTLQFTESNFPFSPEVETLCFSFLTVLKSTPVSQPLTKAAADSFGNNTMICIASESLFFDPLALWQDRKWWKQFIGPTRRGPSLTTTWVTAKRISSRTVLRFEFKQKTGLFVKCNQILFESNETFESGA
jgi:hypothetical protein